MGLIAEQQAMVRLLIVTSIIGGPIACSLNEHITEHITEHQLQS